MTTNKSEGWALGFPGVFYRVQLSPIAEVMLEVGKKKEVKRKSRMEVSKFKQVTFKSEADEKHGSCKCTSTDSGGHCDWCQVYYHGPTEQD